MAGRDQLRPPTIADVAKLAGVSLPTVSRVLTGSTPVRDRTRARVHAAMKELSYRPNGAARALVKGRQPIVGVLTPDVTSYGATQMISAIEEDARRTGYIVAIAVLDPTDLSTPGTAVDILLNQPIAGVIVLDFHRYDKQALRDKVGGVGLVTITDRAEPGFRNIVIDDHGAARQVTEYLLSLGHRTVHLVSVPGSGDLPHPREAGWHEALTIAGAPVPEPIATDWSVESGVRAGTVLASTGEMTAVLCANDDLAFGVMRGLREAGLSVPDDVSIAGMDDHPFAGTWLPSLTTYRLDFSWAGVAGLRLLLSPDLNESTADPDAFRLIERESTARPRPTSLQDRARPRAPIRTKPKVRG